MKETKKICYIPFEKIEIHADGSIRCCCGICNDFFYFGNIFENSIEEIWNGKEMQRFRKSLLDGSYKYCHRDMCEGTDDLYRNSENYKKVMKQLPTDVEISIDGQCNCRCVMCRDDFNRNIVHPEMEKALETKIIPFLANCKLLSLNLSGELFVSDLSKKLITETSKLYPHLRYGIVTNGILCSVSNLKKLNLLKNRIQYISLSLNAATAKTHEKIMRGGKNFNRVMKNIENLKKLVDSHEIGSLCLTFVISSLNYFEMPQMAEICIKNNILGRFWEFRDWGSSEMCKNFEKYDITSPKHPEYKKLKAILKNKVFDSPLVSLDGVLENIRNSKSK